MNDDDFLASLANPSQSRQQQFPSSPSPPMASSMTSPPEPTPLNALNIIAGGGSANNTITNTNSSSAASLHANLHQPQHHSFNQQLVPAFPSHNMNAPMPFSFSSSISLPPPTVKFIDADDVNRVHQCVRELREENSKLKSDLARDRDRLAVAERRVFTLEVNLQLIGAENARLHGYHDAYLAPLLATERRIKRIEREEIAKDFSKYREASLKREATKRRDCDFLQAENDALKAVLLQSVEGRRMLAEAGKVLGYVPSTLNVADDDDGGSGGSRGGAAASNRNAAVEDLSAYLFPAKNKNKNSSGNGANGSLLPARRGRSVTPPRAVTPRRWVGNRPVPTSVSGLYAIAAEHAAASIRSHSLLVSSSPTRSSSERHQLGKADAGADGEQKGEGRSSTTTTTGPQYFRQLMRDGVADVPPTIPGCESAQSQRQATLQRTAAALVARAAPVKGGLFGTEVYKDAAALTSRVMTSARSSSNHSRSAAATTAPTHYRHPHQRSTTPTPTNAAASLSVAAFDKGGLAAFRKQQQQQQQPPPSYSHPTVSSAIASLSVHHHQRQQQHSQQYHYQNVVRASRDGRDNSDTFASIDGLTPIQNKSNTTSPLRSRGGEDEGKRIDEQSPPLRSQQQQQQLPLNASSSSVGGAGAASFDPSSSALQLQQFLLQRDERIEQLERENNKLLKQMTSSILMR